MSRLTHSEHIDQLQRYLDAFEGILPGDLAVEVPTCPGWTLRSLFGHLGRVHRMALAVVSTGAMSPKNPKEMEPVPDNDADLRTYFSASAHELVRDLTNTDPTSPCWTFLGTADEVGFWSRRMAQEHCVHLFDAQRAGEADPTVFSSARSASDGIDEYVLIANARSLAKRREFDLGGTVHLHATDDDDGEWMLSAAQGQLRVEASHGKGDAAIRGTAASLFLGLWGRFDLTTDARFERFGDPSAIAALASIGGN